MLSDTKQLTERMEQSIDKGTGGQISLSRSGGGLAFSNANEAMEFAKMMAVSAQAVPPHCRNNPGVCLGIVIQSIEWAMSPYAVANKSYVVNDRLAYESQIIHAVIEQRAPITARLRHKFDGEGTNRTCTVWATPRGEAEPLSYTSPPVSSITPKNSPLWKTKPDLQLYYNTSRDWARVYFPDVIMGVYAVDEIESRTVNAVATSAGAPPGASLKALTARLEQPAGTVSHVGPVSEDEPEAASTPPAASNGKTEETTQQEPDSSETAQQEPTAGEPRPFREWIDSVANAATPEDVKTILQHAEGELSNDEFSELDNYATGKIKDLIAAAAEKPKGKGKGDRQQTMI